MSKYLLKIFVLFFCLSFTAKELLPLNTVINKDSSKKAKTFNKLAETFLNNSPEKSLKYAKKALQLAIKSNDKKEKADALHTIGRYFYFNDNYYKAIEYYEKSLSIYKIISNKEKMAVLYNSIGNAYSKLDKYTDALKYYQKSLKLFEKINDKKGIASCYNNIGNIHGVLENYTKRKEYFNKAFKIYEELGDKRGMGISYNNIGIIHQDQGNYSKALEYYQKSLKIKEELADKKGMGISYNNIGIIHQDQGNYSKALEYYQKSLKICEQLRDKQGIATSLVNISVLNIKLKQYNDAIEYSEKSLKMSKEIGVLLIKKFAYQSLSESYDSLRNFKKAYEYYKLYKTANDSLFNEEKNKQITEMETKYESQKKEKEITLLKKDSEIKSYKIKQQKAKVWLVSAISFFIIIGVFIIYNFIRIRQKEKYSRELVKQQKLGMLAVNESQENERTRIARDLHDGLGQILAGIKLNFSSFEQDISTVNSEKKEMYNNTLKLIDEVCSEVRSISHQMIPKTLLIAGLKDAIEELIEKYFKNSGIVFDITIHGLNINNKTIEIQLYRIVQEILSNVIKHAQAKQVLISIVQYNSDITLIVEDDGIGITDIRKKNGIGLFNITSRVNSMNGNFTIERGINKGTIVTVEIQLDNINIAENEKY